MSISGMLYLHTPSPGAVPDRILRAIDMLAIDMPVIEHRGPAFADPGKRWLHGIKTIFETTGPVIIYPSSGTGPERLRWSTHYHQETAR